MKKSITIGLLSATMLFGVALVGSAQTINPLVCSPSSTTITVGQNVSLSATGGDNTGYSWSGANIPSSNTTGSTISLSYSTPGNYTVSVNNANQTAFCYVTVNPSSTSSSNNNSSSSSSLSCSPSTQSAIVGQRVNFSASGGTGVYTWSNSELVLSNPNGTGLYATFGTPGSRTITVTSGGQTAVCFANIMALNPVPTPPVTPTFPNTGGGFGK